MAVSQSESAMVTHFMTKSGHDWYEWSDERCRGACNVAEFTKDVERGLFKWVRLIKDADGVEYSCSNKEVARIECP